MNIVIVLDRIRPAREDNKISVWNVKICFKDKSSLQKYILETYVEEMCTAGMLELRP